MAKNIVKNFNDKNAVSENNFSNIKLLVQQLDSYAADKNYIKTINSIIDANKLNKFDAFIYSASNS